MGEKTLKDPLMECDIFEDRMPFRLLFSAEVAGVTQGGMEIRHASDSSAVGTVLVSIKLDGTHKNKRAEIIRRRKDENGGLVTTLRFIEPVDAARPDGRDSRKP